MLEPEDPAYEYIDRQASNAVRKFLKEKNISPIDMIRVMSLNFTSMNTFMGQNDLIPDLKDYMLDKPYVYSPFQLICKLSLEIQNATIKSRKESLDEDFKDIDDDDLLDFDVMRN